MAQLSSKRRNSLPRSAFVYPAERRYPIHDRAHGANALARVKGNGTPAEKKKVYRAVCSRYKSLPACQAGFSAWSGGKS